jgi:hypothetical protein
MEGAPPVANQIDLFMHFLGACSPKVIYSFIFALFDTGISFQDHELVCSRSYETHRQQNSRGLSFYVGWMRGVLYTMIISLHFLLAHFP